MTQNDDMLGTTFIGMEDERFKILDDAYFHRNCIYQWPLRDEFISYWNKFWSQNAFSKWRFYVTEGSVKSGLEMGLFKRIKLNLFANKNA